MRGHLKDLRRELRLRAAVREIRRLDRAARAAAARTARPDANRRTLPPCLAPLWPLLLAVLWLSLSTFAQSLSR